MPTYFQRPENALKRAKEFIDVGKKQRALDCLYDVIKSKKHRTWQKIHEPIMELYLELCVDLRKSHIAKEGLYQYKNICQQVNIKSLEDVVRGFLKLAEEKTEEARESSQQTVLDVEDLDQLTTPESLLLAAVSGESTQDRTDREMLTPWVKFLWEAYRQSLDLLRNNSRVERLYQDTAQAAFRFCIKYGRKTEFRKLCDNLRLHLGHVTKHQNQASSINLNNPESQAMHLETRLAQLDSAINMELWQEAYKAIEDVHGMMGHSKKPTKPQLMANYYQKLALVFWKAGNKLFHACALLRLFQLSRELRKNISSDELSKMATRLLLAILGIPLPPTKGEMEKLLDMQENTVEKQRKLATLLGLSTPPTRASLLKDFSKIGVIQFIPPKIAVLFNLLEVDFDPLKLCIRIKDSLDAIGSFASEKDPSLMQYVGALQNIAIVRLLKQLSQVYDTIALSRVISLIPFSNPLNIELVLIDASRNFDLQARIDHRSGAIAFGQDLLAAHRDEFPSDGSPVFQAMPSDIIRDQLKRMSHVLTKANLKINPTAEIQSYDEMRNQILHIYKKSSKQEHAQILARRQIIEDRKEMLETENTRREREEQEAIEEQRRKAYEQEQDRLNKEAEERDRQRQERERQEVQKQLNRERLEKLKTTAIGSKIVKEFLENEEELAVLDADTILAKQVEQLEREKKELQAKLKAQEKKVDHFVRACHQEEIPLLEKEYEDVSQEDKKWWAEQEAERVETLKKEREEALRHQKRLARMSVDKADFIKTLKEERKNIYRAKLREFEEEIKDERVKRLAERKATRKEERRSKYTKERDEAKQRAAEEKMKREREEEKKREEAEYEERMRKLDEIEEKKREREREIEEKKRQAAEERERKVEKPTKPETKDWRSKEEDKENENKESGNRPWRPSTAGGWREREKERIERWRRPSETEEPGRSSDDRPAQRNDDDRRSAGDDWRRGGPPSPDRRAGPDRGPPSPDRRPGFDRRDDDDHRGPARGDDDDRRGGGSGWRDREVAKDGGDRWRPMPRDGPREDGGGWRSRVKEEPPKDDDRWRRGPRDDPRGPRDDPRGPRDEQRGFRDDPRGPRDDQRGPRDFRDDRGGPMRGAMRDSPRDGPRDGPREGGMRRDGDDWRSRRDDGPRGPPARDEPHRGGDWGGRGGDRDPPSRDNWGRPGDRDMGPRGGSRDEPPRGPPARDSGRDSGWRRGGSGADDGGWRGRGSDAPSARGGDEWRRGDAQPRGPPKESGRSTPPPAADDGWNTVSKRR